MKIASTTENRAVVITGDRAFDVTDLLPLPISHTGGPWLRLFEEGIIDSFLGDLDFSHLETTDFDDLTLAPPIGRPGKIIAAPVNYVDHKVEMDEQKTIADYGIFLKANTSVLGHGQTVQMPYSNKRTDQEGELAVVIGKGGKNISRENAQAHIFGYAPLLDITVRSTEDRSTRKSFDTFTPFGPWIVTRDEIDNPGNLSMKTWVDSELRQDTNTKDLIFDVDLLIEYASSVMTLCPGDIIATGTPAGVGPIHHGSHIVVEIEHIGTLSVNVSAANAILYEVRPGAEFSTRG